MKVEYNDYELVYLVREQNEAALDILIQKYSPIIRKIASSYYGVGFDHDDFFQEGRMAFIKSIDTFDETATASFYSYSMTCVRNRLMTVYRKAKRSAGLDLLTDYTDPTLSMVAETNTYRYLDKDYDTLNERLLLEYALKEKGILSDFEKTCLKYYLLDNNYIEIAAILSVPPKKVDNALCRCKSKLKDLNKISPSSGQYC
ncbi:MAG: sigma-70 family RNA polymerase sigma factor [Turicibacter sp.]|nr:sigma-70 family RNA polymerase sigma factor [Turicibacter sp.]